MELFWYIVLMSMLTIYIILDGYDFGAGISIYFSQKQKRIRKPSLVLLDPFGMQTKYG